jgi:hypothetical protein
MSVSSVSVVGTQSGAVVDLAQTTHQPTNRMKINHKIDATVEQVKNLCSRFKNAVTGKGHETTMSRVADGLSVVMSVLAAGPRAAVASAQYAGKQLNELAKKKPVLAMSLGIAGAILGGLLCSVEPFTGIALTSAAVYTIAKSFKPVQDKLKGLVQKTEEKAKSSAGEEPAVNEPEVSESEIAVISVEEDRKNV